MGGAALSFSRHPAGQRDRRIRAVPAIRLGTGGRLFHGIPFTLGRLRLLAIAHRAGSMTDSARRGDRAPLYEMLFRRHRELYTDNIGCLFERIAKLEEELQLRETERPQLQVFVPSDVVYSENDSIRRALRADVWEKIAIELPASWEGRLRIDPMNVAGEIEIA